MWYMLHGSLDCILVIAYLYYVVLESLYLSIEWVLSYAHRVVRECLLWWSFPSGVCSLGQYHFLWQHGLWDSPTAQRHPDPAAGLQRPPESRHTLLQRPGTWIYLIWCKMYIFSSWQKQMYVRQIFLILFIFSYFNLRWWQSWQTCQCWSSVPLKSCNNKVKMLSNVMFLLTKLPLDEKHYLVLNHLRRSHTSKKKYV